MYLLATHFWWCRLQMVWLSLRMLPESVGRVNFLQLQLPSNWEGVDTVDNVRQLCLRKGLQAPNIHKIKPKRNKVHSTHST